MSGIEIGLLGFLQAALLIVVGFLWRSVAQLRVNEIRHIHDQLKRIEEKLDIHVEWHKKRGDAGV